MPSWDPGNGPGPAAPNQERPAHSALSGTRGGSSFSEWGSGFGGVLMSHVDFTKD